MPNHTPDQHPVRANGRVLAAAMVGSTIEYYDFFIYGTAAALVFGPLFFPQQSPSAQTMLSLLTFGVKGGFEAGKKFYDALGLIKRLVNIGDAKSLACHPASTTHRQMPEAEQRKAGVTPETIRLSIGIEHRDDIIADLDQALAAAAQGKKRIAR